MPITIFGTISPQPSHNVGSLTIFKSDLENSGLSLIKHLGQNSAIVFSSCL